MDLPDDAEVLDTQVLPLTGGRWFAGIRFRVSGQGGYDRAPHDDMFRTFATEAEARFWLDKKLQRRTPPWAND